MKITNGMMEAISDHFFLFPDPPTPGLHGPPFEDYSPSI